MFDVLVSASQFTPFKIVASSIADKLDVVPIMQYIEHLIEKLKMGRIVVLRLCIREVSAASSRT